MADAIDELVDWQLSKTDDVFVQPMFEVVGINLNKDRMNFEAARWDGSWGWARTYGEGFLQESEDEYSPEFKKLMVN